MFRSGFIRKPASLIAIGTVGLVAGHFLYQEYRRRYDSGHGYITANTKPQASIPDQSETAAQEQVDEEPPIDDKSEANAEPKDKAEGDDADEPTDPAEEFEDVLGILDLPRLASFATALRVNQLVRDSAPHLTDSKIMDAACTISDRTFGSYNIAYEITFGDGLVWIARIPGHGHRFEDLDIQKMTSEYHTMRYIKKHIDLPMPDVIYWSTSTDLIGAPFGIISIAEGHPLCDDWQDMPEDKRLTVLTDIAGHMSKLRKLSFDHIGILTFSDDGTPLEVGPSIKFGAHAVPYIDAQGHCTKVWRSWPSMVSCDPFKSSHEAYDGRIDELLDLDHDCDDDSLIALFRMLIETMPPELLNEGQSYLNKPDFALQNIFVDDDDKVTSFIDWDRVSCEDAMSSFAALPLWLCVDWNPNMYCHKPGYTSADGYSDPSSQQLQTYRRHYSNAMAKALEGNTDYDIRMTKTSFVARVMETAIDDQWDRLPIMINLMGKAGVPFTIAEYSKDFNADDAADKEAVIKERFTEAWKAGWYDEDLISGDVDDSQDDGVDKGSSEGSGVMVEPVDSEESEQIKSGED